MMKQIHICGLSPRAGTTLLAEMMKVCFEIDSFQPHEDRLYFRPKNEGRVQLSKTPKDINIVEPSLRADKHLYVICMIRDPRDIICSKHGKAPDRYWTSLVRWKNRLHAFDRCASHPRFIPVRYEDLAEHPDGVQEILETRIPFLTKTDDFSKFGKQVITSDGATKALGGVRSVGTGSLGNWRKHKERVLGQLILHGDLTSDLVRFNYECDGSWRNELTGVVPDFSPSQLPESDRGKYWMLKHIELIHRFLELGIGRRFRLVNPMRILQDCRS